MKKKYIISLDQGTTSSKAVIFDKYSNIIGIESLPINQIYPKPGWVEHNPVEIFQKQVMVVENVLKKTNIMIDEVSTIGITNQRETIVAWNKLNGKPIHNAIVWQCRRTAEYCDKLKSDGYGDLIHKKTGLIIDAYFSGTKIKWIIENVHGAKELMRTGDLLVGTIDSWLIWNFTKGKNHITDCTNASRTMLFNIEKLYWDSELLKILDIPNSILPKVLSSSDDFGFVDESFFGKKVTISGVAGDQHAALFGQTCFEKGDIKSTYGTGCFVLINTGNDIVFSKNKLLTTIAWGINNKITYAVEGSIFNGGASIQWLRDGLGLIEKASDCDVEAMKVDDAQGVYIVPAFTGLGAPYWDMYARGMIIGITRGTTKAHIARATLNAIAFQVRDIIEALNNDTNIKISKLKVDGGASVSLPLMQFQSDILGIHVYRPKIIETTSLGAAYLAGLKVGFWESFVEIKNCWKIDRVFKNTMDTSIKEEKYLKWKEAVNRTSKWIK